MSEPTGDLAPEPVTQPVTQPGMAVAEEAAAPEPLGVELAVTGNAEVDALMERLADADALPTDGHVEVYEDVHRGLRDTLTALDSCPVPPAPARPGP
jgi:hypothetical protein